MRIKDLVLGTSSFGLKRSHILILKIDSLIFFTNHQETMWLVNSEIIERRYQLRNFKYYFRKINSLLNNLKNNHASYFSELRYTVSEIKPCLKIIRKSPKRSNRKSIQLAHPHLTSRNLQKT